MRIPNNAQQLSFWQLIQKERIEIPIIQRDYAQGRKDKAEIRLGFLNAIFKTLLKEDRNLELDFIYGSVKGNTFSPLDGQQRLTTLFLLHWYIAAKEGQIDMLRERFLSQLGNQEKSVRQVKFSYETRLSSREFCYELICRSIDFEQLLLADLDKNGQSLENEVSKTIKDYNWFFLIWEKDPTIDAMLRMLDAIHKKYTQSAARNLWKELVEGQKISFQYLPLEHFGLSDDLYIKMNARGKALTDFENFKARFEQWVDQHKWEENLAYEDSFAHKIDTVWTDLFWRQPIHHSQIDAALIKFIAGIVTINYAEQLEIYKDQEAEERIGLELKRKAKKSETITAEAINRARVEERIRILFNQSRALRPIDFLEKKQFFKLQQYLNLYTRHQNDQLKAELEFWKTNDHDSLFAEQLKTESTTYKQRVLFYAQSQYLMKNEQSDTEFFNHWMRVIRNIVQNATIDSASSFIGAITLVKELSEGCADIYNFLIEKEQLKSALAATQLKEERLKAFFILKSAEDRTLIFKLEDSHFFKGEIGFALETVEVKTTEDALDREALASILKFVDHYLAEKDFPNLVRRAMLTIKDQQFYNYWGSWSFKTNTHKHCLIKDTAELRKKFTKGDNRHYLQELLLQHQDASLEKIIDQFNGADLPNWKKRLIKEADWIDKYAASKYFGIAEDQQSCLLFYNKKRPKSVEDCKLVV